jgi:regulator of protease activity HflC (stomatin/prohibitin superfamily)
VQYSLFYPLSVSVPNDEQGVLWQSGDWLRRLLTPQIDDEALKTVLNRVLAADRNSQAQIIEARAKAETQRIDAQSRAEATRLAAGAETEARRLQEQADAQAVELRAAAQFRAVSEMQKAGAIFRDNPALLRLEELRTLRDLAQNANARLYIGFDKHTAPAADKPAG